MDQKQTYVSIMITSLKAKASILDELTAATKKQELLIQEKKLDTDAFTELLKEKEELIEKLGSEDAGFEALYGRVEAELKDNRGKYRPQVLAMQELIGRITDKSVALTAMEQRNKLSMDRYFARKKKEIKDYQNSSKTVSSYYKSMADRHQGQSYFLDQKK